MHGLYTESREEPARSPLAARSQQGEGTQREIKLKGRTDGGTSLK